jgi:hypothetical protein
MLLRPFHRLPERCTVVGVGCNKSAHQPTRSGGTVAALHGGVETRRWSRTEVQSLWCHCVPGKFENEVSLRARVERTCGGVLEVVAMDCEYDARWCMFLFLDVRAVREICTFGESMLLACGSAAFTCHVMPAVTLHQGAFFPPHTLFECVHYQCLV